MALWSDFQPEPDDNQAAPPVGAPEGSYKGSVVNDTFRYVMAAIRNLGDAVLHLDGTMSPTADMNWGGFKITNFGSGTARTHAARLDQVQDGKAWWGGTTTGSGSAYTVSLTPSFSGTLNAGAIVRAIIHTANTSTTPTLDVGSPSGAKTIVHRDGSALQTETLSSGTRYTFEYDGTNWRALDAGGYMEQETYDRLHPVGDTILRRTTTDPNTQLPRGVTATWTRTTTEAYLRIEGGTPTTGGSLTTSSTALTVNQIPAHSHTATIDISSSGTYGEVAVAGRNTVTEEDFASNNIVETGNTGGSDGHTHTITPTFRSYAVWERTA